MNISYTDKSPNSYFTDDDANEIKNVVNYNSDLINKIQKSGVHRFTGLHDTPNEYSHKAGQYLVVNNLEDGLIFTGIENIAQDLTAYGFLSSTPTSTSSSSAQTYTQIEITGSEDQMSVNVPTFDLQSSNNFELIFDSNAVTYFSMNQQNQLVSIDVNVEDAKNIYEFNVFVSAEGDNNNLFNSINNMPLQINLNNIPNTLYYTSMNNPSDGSTGGQDGAVALLLKSKLYKNNADAIAPDTFTPSTEGNLYFKTIDGIEYAWTSSTSAPEGPPTSDQFGFNATLWLYNNGDDSFTFEINEGFDFANSTIATSRWTIQSNETPGETYRTITSITIDGGAGDNYDLYTEYMYFGNPGNFNITQEFR